MHNYIQMISLLASFNKAIVSALLCLHLSFHCYTVGRENYTKSFPFELRKYEGVNLQFFILIPIKKFQLQINNTASFQLIQIFVL